MSSPSSSQVASFSIVANPEELSEDWVPAASTCSEVSIVFNGLDEFHPGFNKLTSATSINLHANALITFPDDAFGDCTALTKLNLSDNRLSALPKSLLGRVSLTHLLLTTNDLDELNGDIGSLTRLQHLALSDNILSSLPSSLVLCEQLSTLEIARNALKEFPPCIYDIISLTKLDVSRNRISELLPDIQQLTNLVELNLFSNHLFKLPYEVTTLPKLEDLHLGANELRIVPDNIGALISLKSLSLFQNHIAELPESLGCLVNLRELHVSYNKLEELPVTIENCTSLTDIRVSGNKLSYLPPNIGQLERLTRLSINRNAIPSLPVSFGVLPALERLDMAFNMLTAVPAEILEVTTLQCLDLSANLLGVRSTDWNKLSCLKELKLSHNGKIKQIGALPPGLQRLYAENVPSSGIETRVHLMNSSDIRSPLRPGRFDVAHSDVQGQRSSMEDSLCIQSHDDALMICVCDGHNGSGAARFATYNFIERSADFCYNPTEELFSSVFTEVHDQIISGGTTVAMVVIDQSYITAANVGDSRAVLCRKGKAIRLTTDHRPSDTEEAKRIQAAGGYVSDDGALQGTLGTSRSLGDADMAKFLCIEPSVTVTEVEPNDEFVVVACDGLWDILADQEVVDMLRPHVDGSLQLACDMVRDKAWLAGSLDNITVVVAKVRPRAPMEKPKLLTPIDSRAGSRRASIDASPPPAVDDPDKVLADARKSLVVKDAPRRLGYGAAPMGRAQLSSAPIHQMEVNSPVIAKPTLSPQPTKTSTLTTSPLSRSPLSNTLPLPKKPMVVKKDPPKRQSLELTTLSLFGSLSSTAPSGSLATQLAEAKKKASGRSTPSRTTVTTTGSRGLAIPVRRSSSSASGSLDILGRSHTTSSK